ncbi:Signal peptidase complex subunit 2 [Entamoeba marina]
MTADNLTIPKASMYNPVELKKVLDLSLEHVLKNQYKKTMNYWFSNTIILCSFICSILGVVAWYFTSIFNIPWPESYWFIVAIVIGYVIVDGFLTIMMWFTHKGYVLETKEPKAAFYSEMVKYTPYYKLTIIHQGKKEMIDIAVNKVINTEGKVLINKFSTEVDNLLKKSGFK